MKCEICDNKARHHLTEMTEGVPLTIHVCDEHFSPSSADVASIKARRSQKSRLQTLLEDNDTLAAYSDLEARAELSKYEFPALCAALTDANPNVRVQAAIRMLHASDQIAAARELKTIQDDPDELVAKVARAAIGLISEQLAGRIRVEQCD